MASHVTRKRSSVSPQDLSRDRCSGASDRGNGRPTKETMRWSKNPWARCVAPPGMTGTLLSPPRLTPRRRSVRPASSLNQLPSRCSITSLEGSPHGIRRANSTCRKRQEVEHCCCFIPGQPEQVHVRPIILQDEDLVAVTCQGYLPPPERLVTGTVAPDDSPGDRRRDGTPEHQGSVFASPLDRLGERHEQLDGIGVFPQADNLEGPRATQDKLGKGHPERC